LIGHGEERREEVSVEKYLAKPGDVIRLRSGPYAGAAGTVVSVHPDENHPAENSLVMVKLLSGRINSCYMSNLEKFPLPPDSGSSGAS
jgi:transcription antitermination factor NusG